MDLHTLQLIFYTLGSILFVFALLLIIAAIIAIFIIKRKFDRITHEINGKISQAWDMYDHKEKYILKFLGKGSSSIIEAVSSIFVKSKK